MAGIFKKPLFWTNVAAFVFAAWLIASLVFGFNPPLIAPPNGSGTIQVDLSGNVGIGGLPSALAKLRVVGDLLVDTGFGVTLGGIKRLNWPGLGSNNFCAGGFCVSTATDKIYLTRAYAISNPPYVAADVTSYSMPGVLPSSNVSCAGGFCEIAGVDKTYLTSNHLISNAPYLEAYIAILTTPGVRPYSKINCAASCNITTADQVYVSSPHAISAAPYVESYTTTISTPGVTISD